MKTATQRAPKRLDGNHDTACQDCGCALDTGDMCPECIDKAVRAGLQQLANDPSWQRICRDLAAPQR